VADLASMAVSSGGGVTIRPKPNPKIAIFCTCSQSSNSNDHFGQVYYRNLCGRVLLCKLSKVFHTLLLRRLKRVHPEKMNTSSNLFPSVLKLGLN
jgi:hypothetical protein